MNITNVTVTKVAEESTENADYQLEYSIVNDALTRVHASIRKKDTDGSGNAPQIGIIYICLLYTSDAADDLLCVDLGGRRLIKKKKHA